MLISELERKFRSLTHLDVGFTPGNYYTPRCIVYTELIETPELSMGLFGMSTGCNFPIHDHPSMLAATFVLSGRLQYRNYDISSRERGGVINLSLCMEGEARGGELLFLTPKRGNLHQIQALENSVFLDVFIPSYNDIDRPCTYYQEVAPNKVVSFVPQLPFKSLPYVGRPLY
mmetsp:Transcript_12409/g.12460  ORF Transcript_12409/g.12460 Transcript_12409/m.12460 type:complete len:173 (+) Transcript_12409:125-643(+)